MSNLSTSLNSPSLLLDELEVLDASSTPDTSSARTLEQTKLQNTLDMRLNFDCIFVIMFHLPMKSDVLSMALTCRTIYTYALPYIQFWSISVNEETVDDICDRLLVNNFPSRMQFVRELELGPIFDVDTADYDESPKTVSLAADVLVQAQNLTSLKFPSLGTFGARKCLAAACEGNLTLRRLHISSAGPEDCVMVDNLQASLSALRLDISYAFVHPGSQDFTFPDLTRFASSLKEVRISTDRGFFRVPSAPCNKVHTLILKDASCADLRALTRAFPNIRKLKYFASPFAYRPYGSKDDLARANLRAQAKDPWPLLESVTADISSLYILNLRCQIRRLNVYHYPFNRKNEFKWLVEYLDLIGPPTLGLTFTVFELDWLRHINAIKERYTELSNLVVDMGCVTYLARRDAAFKALRAIGSLFPSVTHLIVRIKWVVGMDYSLAGLLRKAWDRDSRCVGHAWPPYERRWMEKLDLRKFVLRLAKSLPSLSFVFLEIVGKPRSYWQVDHGKKGHYLTELTADMSEAILAERGL
ncbi:hypothetical protein OBBRIDRAFT_835797 [Obba rivulosa]|uniref:Uncharacterized protein n=1 Tax=Obba rivulosa TaxID=1052685 RepID=A0A8E2AZK5_9APHY|nr:hypothetical protein OBBRIDRAFT_835797 [Obba rivulosa]